MTESVKPMAGDPVCRLVNAARGLCFDAICADCGNRVRDADPLILVDPHASNCRVGVMAEALTQLDAEAGSST